MAKPEQLRSKRSNDDNGCQRLFLGRSETLKKIPFPRLITQPGTPLAALILRWTTARFANKPQALSHCAWGLKELGCFA
jgi:hypothetical protein